MKQYHDLLTHILGEGTLVENRTGVKTLSVPGAAMRFDMKAGFPAITTRRLPFKTAMGELVGFLRATSSAAGFRALGCKVWDQNANENQAWLNNPYREGHDDLGPIYGVQWRKWPAYKRLKKTELEKIKDALGRGYEILAEFKNPDNEDCVVLYKEIDQVRECLDKIMHNPQDRRIIFHGWNPADLESVALPSCHAWYQFLPNPVKKELSISLYLRSNDTFLGLGMNLAEAAALLSLFARLAGYTPRWINYIIGGDAHIYENHIDVVREQLTREPLPLPTLEISERVPDFAVTGVYQPEWLDLIEPGDFALKDYQHHGVLTAPMAV
ncbi:thymidylate synthase (plasmid) [Pseudomonas sp. Leaf58]|uniref:thymidylate synthase n=1 Tax=Pseudomonas sp. Leaf58 TaxID=1736226 RepID=UPI0006F4C1CF|nr:thymidylate synthase [Pseudomonas sp. Leaf58]AYG47681.1 thymidylate synthase [Pseudomonas sp. Leaf58]KQN62757.1 thymidylate synthase [Pseudomonas sp. Leaf58]